MASSWVISKFPAPDLDGQTVEFRLPGDYGELRGVGTFKARALSGRRVTIWIRLHVSADWARKEEILFRVPQDPAKRIELHPNQSVARFRLFPS